MTIDELKSERDALAVVIQKQITEFEKRSGAIVEKIEIERHTVTTLHDSQRRTIASRVDIRLSI